MLERTILLHKGNEKEICLLSDIYICLNESDTYVQHIDAYHLHTTVSLNPTY